jgi:hypothetical protein
MESAHETRVFETVEALISGLINCPSAAYLIFQKPGTTDQQGTLLAPGDSFPSSGPCRWQR